ncbi:hypothetical protein M433DRAFT_186770 [Acidomyces richmondensis BFW]|nr:MAG: hypothetical protein FE78DRAFT_342531 [Acidomyces sp. 'richmondensis']KYG46757.1 hypothetical protein M433DRAFT_186770 [Acidomyces richmondensis BFW]
MSIGSEDENRCRMKFQGTQRTSLVQVCCLKAHVFFMMKLFWFTYAFRQASLICNLTLLCSTLPTLLCSLMHVESYNIHPEKHRYMAASNRADTAVEDGNPHPILPRDNKPPF